MSPYVVRSPWGPAAGPGPLPTSFTRAEAQAIVDEFVKNENLKKHMYAVEIAMRGYALKYSGDPEEWSVAGLLHDFDWEIHPTAEEHPAKGQLVLVGKGVPEAIRRAIMAHAEHTGVKPETPMERCLYAVDELTGFIVACALVTPDKSLANVTVDGIKKKLKQKAFAAKVNREEIEKGVKLIGLSEDEHFGNVLKFMQDDHDKLGL